MRLRIAAVLLLLVLHVIPALADRTNERNTNPEVAIRRHDSEERTTGRRWTTSRNSPYQKIVSSYDRAPDAPELDSEPEETSTAEVPDEAKAKSPKRKQWRTNASSRDQIPSESSSAGESKKAEPEKSATEATDLRVPEVQRNSKVPGSPSRRRSAPSHPRELTPDSPLPELTTSSPKKRRRPTVASVTTTTLAPQTMSDSLYQYFRPLDQDVPQDDIIPFLDFGRKLSAVLPTPSGVNGANSIDNKSTVTKPRPRIRYEDKESNPSDEEMLQEDMDVTVVKKAIERNSVPRGKLRVREQGISEYYKKRVPPQIRTTENLVSTSDSSTASSIPGSKTVGLYKKNRHQIHHAEPAKFHGETHYILLPESKNNFEPKDVEIVQQKRRQFLSRPIQRLAALKQETPASPLTAESTLVKTIIKEPPVQDTQEPLSRNVTKPSVSNTNTTIRNTGTSQKNITSSLQPNHDVNTTKSEPNSKILSTAVVTSVSIEESMKEGKQHLITEAPIENNKTVHLNAKVNQTALNSFESKNKSSSELPSRSFILPKTSTNNNIATSTSEPLTSTRPPLDPKPHNNVKNDSSLRSKDIYRPKAVPPGIPHLPRQIPIPIPPRNLTAKVTTLSDSSDKTTTTTDPVTRPTVPSTTAPTTTTQLPTTTISSTSTPIADITQPNIITLPLTTVIQETTPIPKVPQNHTNEKETHNETTTRISVTNKHDSVKPTEESTDLEEDSDLNIKETFATDNEEHPELSFEEPLVHVKEENSSQSPKNYVEIETLPPQKIEIPTLSPDVEGEDQFPIYFTTLPTATVPVVDTRPETEAAVVEEQKNATTPRPREEWVKVGAVNKDVEVVYPEPLGLGAYLLAGLGVVPVILGALIGARFILAHNKKKVLDESEYSSEYNRSPLSVSTVSPLPTKLPRIPTHVPWSGGGAASGSEMEKNVNNPVTSSSTANRWEFPREKLRLQTLLGQGNFGQVWKAEADDIAGHEGLTRLVAVKTVKESANAREREDLLRELGIMQELGSHPNVVTLLGCCTEKEPIYLVMEYVMYGKLLSFLRDYRTRAHYYNFSDAGDALTSRDLTVFGYCVARGMDYLSNKSIIHRDMAARNVLVDHNKLCKIADFGMSRNVRDTGQIYEQRQSKGALPIRWMAPESLHFSLFTHKTDVWSFGILMWEIVTLGSTPYATMGAREVMRRVRDGYRLERPSHCRPELFRVIARCWESEPAKRPTFAELKVELGQLLSDSELNGSYVDLDSFADEMRRDTLHRHH